MIEKSKTIEGADICDGNDAVEVDYDIDLQDLRKHCLPMEDLKALNVECMRVRVLDPRFRTVLHYEWTCASFAGS